jgi:hypothetical protein
MEMCYTIEVKVERIMERLGDITVYNSILGFAIKNKL